MKKPKQSSKPLSIQAKIEKAMRFYSEGIRWETMVLFTSEGLPLARYGKSPYYQDDNLLEFAFSLIHSSKLLKNDTDVSDIVIQGKKNKKLIFKFFQGLGDDIILTAVVTERKGYKRAMSHLIKWIQSLT